jgi:diadenosine tetraphosphate (Ap4A) HIT family hydrolase
MDCLFCEFINGKEKHSLDNKFTKNKPRYPLVPIFENESVFSFLSVPNNRGETHILVIPKEHHEFIEDISEKSLKKIFPIIAKMAGIIRKNYGDCNILLNNGKNADQYVKHVHFHIIPHNSKKNLLWENPSHKEFEKISGDLSSLFRDIR